MSRGLHTETLLAITLPLHTALGCCNVGLSYAKDAPVLWTAPRAAKLPLRHGGRFLRSSQAH